MRKKLTVMAALAALVFSTMAAAHLGNFGGATIHSPQQDDSFLAGTLALSASYGGWETNDTLNWRITSNEDCSTGNNMVGDGPNVSATQDDIIESSYVEGEFSANIDTSAWEVGEYCFIFNPAETTDDNVARVTFTIADTELTKDACKKGGWEEFADYPGPFRNQGECVSYFASDGKSAK